MTTASDAAAASETSGSDGEPLAIIAGAGALPFEAARLVRARRPVTVFALDKEADDTPADLADLHVVRFGYHEIGRVRRLLREAGCHDLLLLGAIRARPDFTKILGDWETMRLVPKIVRAIVGGDDTIVRNVVGLMESEGYRIVAVADAVPELLAQAGQLSRAAPTEAHEADIARASAFLDAAAPFDMGQAAVAVAGRIIAMEGAEGTDAMLRRCADLRAARRVRALAGTGVLVKRAKRGQDTRADLPVVGAATVALAASAGLGGVAIEAGRTILAEREAAARAADRARLFLVAR